MSQIQTTLQVDSEGNLHLDLPLGRSHAGAECVVTVQVQESRPIGDETSRDERWDRIFSATAGKWQGEPLVRPDQGRFEERELFD
jgi:hypothetical protein